MLPLRRSFNSTCNLNARFPALPTRISRASNQKNQKKIVQLKQKLGEKYRLLGRDKRQSPYTERNSPSKPTQPPKPQEKIPLIKPFLYQKDKNPNELSDDLLEKLEKIEIKEDKQEKAEKQSLLSAKIHKKKEEVETNEFTKLSMPEQSIPKKIVKDGVEQKTATGPYYQYGVKPSELEFVLETTPALTSEPYSADKRNLQQAEMVRRIISMENGNQRSIKKFNVQRVVEIFQRTPQDTGSSEVQGI